MHFIVCCCTCSCACSHTCTVQLYEYCSSGSVYRLTLLKKTFMSPQKYSPLSSCPQSARKKKFRPVLQERASMAGRRDVLKRRGSAWWLRLVRPEGHRPPAAEWEWPSGIQPWAQRDILPQKPDLAAAAANQSCRLPLCKKRLLLAIGQAVQLLWISVCVECYLSPDIGKVTSPSVTSLRKKTISVWI